MKYKKFFTTFLCVSMSLSLSSCFIDDLVSNMLSEVVISDQNHTDTGESVRLIDKAFNGKTEELSSLTFDTNIDENDDYQVVEINENITNLKYNEGQTPSTGNVKGLVIPVDFPDKIIDNSITNDDLCDPEWESVSSFYYKSSYGKLNLSFDVMDWYTCKNQSRYYESLSNSKYQGDAPGVSAIIEEALTYYRSRIDLSQYDSNNDGIIDALYIIYNHEIDYTNGDFWWAFQYYSFETKKYSGLECFPYVFAGYNFLFEDNQKCNTHTYIHETAHMFGIEDYYDSDSKSGKNTGGLGGLDLMDYTIGDHNSFTKIALGWIDKVILINDDKLKSIKLKALQNSPAAIMVSSTYNADKGMFQNYYLLEYYTPTKLQELDKIYSINGVRLLRINAELTTFTENNYSYEYFKFNNSTTVKNMIDVILPTGGEYQIRDYNYSTLPGSDEALFTRFNISPKYVYEKNNKTAFPYPFIINNLNDEYAEITFNYSIL